MRSFLDRVTDAVTELRDPLPSKSLNLEVKEAPDYGQSGQWNNGWSLPPGIHTNLSYRGSSNRLDFAVSELSSSSLVMAVVNDTGVALAEAIPCVKIKKGKRWQLDAGHVVAKLVQQPNIIDVWADVCLALSLSLWIDGNAYLLKSRNDEGTVVELWYLPHDLVEPRFPGDKMSPEVPTSGPNKATNNVLSHYQYNIPGKTPVLYRREDVIHFKRGKRLDNPRKGVGAFDSVIKEIYGDEKAAEFTATILRNLGIVVPIISPKEKDVTLDETQAHAIRERYEMATTGANAGRPVINGIAIDVAKVAFSPQELDLKALRAVPESRIAAVTRYPAAYLQFLVGLENGTSYASYEQAREQAYEQVVIPIQNSIATTFTWQLLNEFDDKAKFAFDNSEVRVLQEDRNELFRREGEALKSGGITLDEYREAVGKDPVGGDLGNVRYVPSSTRPMNEEQILKTANGENQPQMNTDPNAQPDINPDELAKWADMERYFVKLEEQMQGFQR